MPVPEAPETYRAYKTYLWEQLEQRREPRTLALLLSAECRLLQIPLKEIAAAKPDIEEIRGWAEKIEASGILGSMMADPKLDASFAGRDAEALVLDLNDRLWDRSRGRPLAHERAIEKQSEQTVPTLAGMP